jgi:hypothetical protein
MEKTDLDVDDAPAAVQLADVRYWSDFNRLYYLPRTIQKIPDISDWEDAEGNWAAGHETFARYDEVPVHPCTHVLPLADSQIQDTGLMEGPLRLFLEECETIQVPAVSSQPSAIHQRTTHRASNSSTTRPRLGRS